MAHQEIKNVVFDIGNVVVRWSPQEILRLTFGEDADFVALTKSIFQSDIWLALNKGQLSEREAKLMYQNSLGFSELDCDRLFYYVKHSQIILHGSIDLILKIKAAGYPVFALTDNVHEIVNYLQSNYRFWPLFDGAVVSADVGVGKPEAEIYQLLLNRYQLNAKETVFIDDMAHNVAGAQAIGMAAIRFEDAQQCKMALQSLGVIIA